MTTDRQITGMAGEFLVVGKLFKQGLQASITFGNAKAIDVLAYNPDTDKTFPISVKTLRRKNCFPLKADSISEAHTYIFVLLNDLIDAERYFIVPGHQLTANPATFFGASLQYSSRSAVNFGPLAEYEDNWHWFSQ